MQAVLQKKAKNYPYSEVLGITRLMLRDEKKMMVGRSRST